MPVRQAVRRWMVVAWPYSRRSARFSSLPASPPMRKECAAASRKGPGKYKCAIAINLNRIRMPAMWTGPNCGSRAIHATAFVQVATTPQVAAFAQSHPLPLRRNRSVPCCITRACDRNRTRHLAWSAPHGPDHQSLRLRRHAVKLAGQPASFLRQRPKRKGGALTSLPNLIAKTTAIILLDIAGGVVLRSVKLVLPGEINQHRGDERYERGSGG